MYVCRVIIWNVQSSPWAPKLKVFRLVRYQSYQLINATYRLPFCPMLQGPFSGCRVVELPGPQPNSCTPLFPIIQLNLALWHIWLRSAFQVFKTSPSCLLCLFIRKILGTNAFWSFPILLVDADVHFSGVFVYRELGWVEWLTTVGSLLANPS